jgi:peptidyl-prolyl cis-trans isomerase B (cyclophilin B)
MPTPRRLLALAACLLGALVVFALAGCSSTQTPTAAPVTSAQSSGSPTQASEPASAPGGEAQPVAGEEPLHISKQKVTGNEMAVVTTNKGVFKFKFFAKDAPNSVASFIELADAKFYDKMKWHRVVKTPGQLEIIQGGDPLSRTLPLTDPRVGTGGPGWRLPAEFGVKQPDGSFIPRHKHLRGTVALARSDSPDSAGSQFYICLAPQSFLDGQYTVIGQVTTGMDVVDKIAAGDSITSIRIVGGK